MSMLIFLLTRLGRSLQCERAHIRTRFAMRVTAETKAETRQRILDAAQQLFAVGGFATSTTRDIADRAGIATGTLFNYFTSKEAALATLAAEAVAGVEQDFDGSDCNTFEEELFAFVGPGLRKLKPLTQQ